MGTFIAVVPPASVTRKLQTLGASLRSVAPALRVEPAEKLHFTLEFLGEKEPPWLNACRTTLEALASDMPPFPVTIRAIGFFPPQPAVRVVWAGSQPNENEHLCSLADAVRRACAALGHIPDPKPFHPHITLSRVKHHLSPGTVERIAGLAFEACTFTCTEICVMKSNLSRHGSDYETLFTIPLQQF